MQGLRGHLCFFLPSPPLRGRKRTWNKGVVSQPALPGHEVDVLRGLGRPQREVLQQSGQEEEEPEGAKLTQTEAFSLRV